MDNEEITDVSIIRERVKEINHDNENYDWGDITDTNREMILSKIKKNE